jgi:hypothetical protein
MIQTCLRSLAVTALLAASVGGAVAASPTDRVVSVPPGAIVLVLPAGVAPGWASPGWASDDSPFENGMISPIAMMQQVNRMMQAAFADPAQDQMMQAAMQQMQSRGPSFRMVVTSISNGQGTCTRQVRYSGSADAPKVDVSMTGNACPAANSGTPAVVPAPAQRSIPATLRVERTRRAPIQVAQLDR